MRLGASLDGGLLVAFGAMRCTLLLAAMLGAVALPAAAQTRAVARQLGTIPKVPAAPPDAAVIPALAQAPAHPTAPPPPPTVQKKAKGASEAIAGGVRVSFGAGSSALNPATDKAILALAPKGRADGSLIYTVTAHAPGSAQDVSTPRRLSLERAMAARSVLINAGIASTRIYVHALGATAVAARPAGDEAEIVVGTVDAPVPATHAAGGVAGGGLAGGGVAAR